MDFKDILATLKVKELQKIAGLAKIDNANNLKKEELIIELATYEENQDSNGVRFAQLLKEL